MINLKINELTLGNLSTNYKKNAYRLPRYFATCDIVVTYNNMQKNFKIKIPLTQKIKWNLN